MTAAGMVSLVGAGPGDPELLTLRGARRLREADVVLYDALVHPDVLEHCRADAEKTYVGKRAGRVSERQSAIIERMIDAARAGRRVVRLKGGDPYLFGRGSEEVEALHAAGIPFEVIPGVPSPTAATAYAGISLTHREYSSSVAYVTATESPEKDRSSHDWSKLATATETLVVFMGLRKLESLMKLLVEHGRAPSTPVAVIEWASLPRQRTVTGTLETISELVRDAGLGMPALTVVGDVVRLREQLRWYDRQPLFGARVLVTRPAERSDALARMLRDEGAEPICLPAIEIAPPADSERLRDAVRSASTYDWVVFTSATGVAAFFDEAATQGRDARVVGSARLCAIGPATAASLAERGLRADLVPSEYRGEAVASALRDAHGGQLGGVRVLLPRAEVAREVLPDTLRTDGALVDVVSAYRNVDPSPATLDALRHAVVAREIDVVTFTAPSTVESLARALGPELHALASVFVASIGPITTAAAERLGVRVDVTADEYTAKGLVRALRAGFGRATSTASPGSDST